jgi:polysaccharide deacetylase family sporulation protein PdaB
MNKRMKYAAVLLFMLLCVVMPLFGITPKKLSVEQPSGQQIISKEKSETDAYWNKAEKEVYKSVHRLKVQNKQELSAGQNLRKLMRGDSARKEIALTFDDGPHPKFTPQILEILKRNNVKATFFLVGALAEKNPALVKMEIANGHSIGNHTYHHVNLTKIPPQYVATEIQACGDVLKSLGVKNPHLFRPPGGDYDLNVATIANNLGYTIVLWTDDPGDYLSPGESTIKSRTLSKAKNGGIILIHDGVQQTVNVLPDIIKTLKSRGYKFVTIDDWLNNNGKP